MNEIYPNIKGPKFSSQLYFEISSWAGRYFKKRKSKITPTQMPLLLDIGVGGNFKDGWTHIDFYNFRLKFWKKYSKHRKPEIETDLRYPLNCPSNIVDGACSGHTLEHLYPNHAYQLLSEIFRVLNPKCWLRINVPDLKYAMDFYNGKIAIPEINIKLKLLAI